MKILIVEDEPPIARDFEDLSRLILKEKISSVKTCFTLANAIDYLQNNDIDLCILDLNLNGKSGFDILNNIISGSFHTIIISAHTQQAIRAFEYGVLDFLPKPVDKERLELAFDRFLSKSFKSRNRLKYLSVRKRNKNYLLDIKNVIFFKSDGYIIEVHCKNKIVEIIEKPLNRLEQILPDNFIRIHRSYIIDSEHMQSFYHEGGGVYRLKIISGEIFPLSPRVYKILKNDLT